MVLTTRVKLPVTRQSPGGAHRGNKEVGADENTFQGSLSTTAPARTPNKAIGKPANVPGRRKMILS